MNRDIFREFGTFGMAVVAWIGYFSRVLGAWTLPGGLMEQGITGKNQGI